MREVRLHNVVVTIGDELITHRYDDGTVNEMHLSGIDDLEHRGYAEWAGYGDDLWRYIVHHDLAHHWFSHAAGMPYSLAVHDGDGNVPLGEASAEMKWEEHCVNRLLRQLNAGDADPYGCLQKQFGDTLPERITELRTFLESAY